MCDQARIGRHSAFYFTDTLRLYLIERKKMALPSGWRNVPEWLFFNQEGIVRTEEGNKKGSPDSRKPLSSQYCGERI